jgi:hypothetical protein
MKERPRSVEREVALHLSNFSRLYRFKPIERIPILGRTGPDLTINELKLVVDVKSRLEVPKGIFYCALVEFDGMLAVPLRQLGEIVCSDPRPVDFISKTVRDYYVHMDAWRRENFPDGISALVLHRPKKPIGLAMFIIHKDNRSKLCQIINP